MFDVSGRKVILTGGTGGIGKAIAKRLVDSGAIVTISGTKKTVLDEISSELSQNAFFLVNDLSESGAVETLLSFAYEKMGEVDILINNVGGRREDIPTEDMSLEKWRELMDLNLTSTFVCTSRIGKAMIAAGQGGRIINIGSINSLIAGRNITGRHYETAKGAVLQLTRSVAADWAQHGITVNAILPGGFMTEPNQKWAREKPDVVSIFRQQIPMGDHGQPEDLGPLALYLASDASRYMTGAGLVIDGGYTLW